VKKCMLVFSFLGCLLVAPVAWAQGVLVGVNVTNNEGYLSEAFQDDEMKHLAENGVKTVRVGLVAYNIDFIIKAYQHDISSVVIVFPFRGTKTWSDVKLSQITAQEFTEKFKPLLDKLETAGVRLAAFELGNEINTARFNGDLPDPGSGRELRLADLDNSNDPEGQAVAKGYRAYVQVMATLKDLRDHSKLNQHTPIISAGLAQKLGGKQDEVNLLDAIEFFRQNGMDKLVDGFGIHVYPSADLKRLESARIASLDEGMCAACRQGGKPCWVTEWGFGNADESCPVKDGTRLKLNQDMRSVFQHFANLGLLGALIYYDWTGAAGKNDSWGVFRCGALTDAGKLALKPM